MRTLNRVAGGRLRALIRRGFNRRTGDSRHACHKIEVEPEDGRAPITRSLTKDLLVREVTEVVWFEPNRPQIVNDQKFAHVLRMAGDSE